MKNIKRIMAIAFIVIAVSLLLTAVAAWPDFGKKDTKLKFKTESPITQGDAIKIKLKDVDGNPLANKTVNITVKCSHGFEKNYSVITNKNGNAKLKLKIEPDEYQVCCTFEGDDGLNASSANRTFTIEEDSSDVQTESTTSDYDPGAFYSAQAGRTIYTGEVQEGPDGHTWKHLGYNEWVKID